MTDSNFVFFIHFPKDVKVENVVWCIHGLLGVSKCHAVIRIDSRSRKALFVTEFSPDHFMLLSEGLKLIEDSRKINDDECDSEIYYFIHTGDTTEGKLYMVSKQFEETIQLFVENTVADHVTRSITHENIVRDFKYAPMNVLNASKNDRNSKVCENIEVWNRNNTSASKHNLITKHIYPLTDNKTNDEDPTIDADKVKSPKGQHLNINGNDNTNTIRSSSKGSIVVLQTQNKKENDGKNEENNLESSLKVKHEQERLKKVLPRSSTLVLNYISSGYKTSARNKNNDLRKARHARERTEHNLGVKGFKRFEDNSDDQTHVEHYKIISLHPHTEGDDAAVTIYPKAWTILLRDIIQPPGKEVPQHPVVLQIYPSRKQRYNKPAIRRTQQGSERRAGEHFSVQVSEEGNQAAGPPTFDSLLTSSESIFGCLPVASERPQPQQPTAPTTNLTASLADEQTLTSRRHGLNQISTRHLPRPPRHPEYADRNRRQMSFTNWPTTTYQDPTLMTNYGFFYTGRFDLVRCYQCGIGLKDWAESDEPLFEHIKHASDCPFLLELLGPDLLAAYKVNLIPAGATPIANAARPGTQGAAPAGQTRSQGADAGSTEPPGIRSPEYADMEARIRSYNSSWPSDISQTPQQLAEAGFFYTGYGDVCRCFTCDGGLQRWDPQDDPWIEHTRWFSHCDYVRRMKGDEYVELVRRAQAASSEDEDPAVVYPPPGQGVGNLTGAMANLAIATLDPLSTPSAQSVLNMGYARRAVLLAIHELDARGKADYTGKDLIQVLMDKEDRGEALPTDSPTNSMPTGGAEGGFNDPIVLQSENQRLKGILKCMRCDIRDCNMLFLPCTHHRLCEECSEDVEICPICERQIAEKIRTYLS